MQSEFPDNQNPEQQLSTDNASRQLTVHPFKDKNLFSLKGRLNRLDYTILWFSLILLTFLLSKYFNSNPVLIALNMMYDPEALDASVKTYQLITFSGLFALMFVSVRRFHDLGYVGWYSLALLIPIIGHILRLILVFAKGNPETNRFGERPAPNHRNKLLIVIVLGVLIYMVFSSFAQEAMPMMQEYFDEIQNTQ
jgi:uncharacterized membrane protein YhaH (DUF805 family)